MTPAPHDGAREAALLAFWNAVNYFADSHPRIVIGNEMRVRAVEAVDSTLSALIAERVEAAVAEERREIDIVFDAPPGPIGGHFVEVESPPGRSIRFGEWIHRDDGYWVLRFRSRAPSATERGGGEENSQGGLR